MESFQVAHLQIQNVNVVIIFLATIFDSKSPHEQSTILRHLQAAATSAGLAGNVVLVWLDQFGRTKFNAPQQQHPFFQSVSYSELYAQVNRTLTVD